MNLNEWRSILLIAISTVFLSVLMLFLATFDTGFNYRVSISWAFGSMSLVVFFGLYLISKRIYSEDPNDSKSIKDAITGTMIAVYMMVITFYIFKEVPTQDTELVGTIVAHFTYLVGIVIVSHFGSDALKSKLGM
ncbi:hypothetical protein HNP93_001406 [Methanococcus maripaludis]|uniref:Uncharacterized protein n=1 Tax=Methanococcus maripaludis TaxID=39152 RepID=A0A7J9P666_METMI|nr:hypothetical protein [Methanococcus maripaludis]MBA2858705.1 hypothetical protein [Methanococcus maripaludis]